MIILNQSIAMPQTESTWILKHSPQLKLFTNIYFKLIILLISTVPTQFLLMTIIQHIIVFLSLFSYTLMEDENTALKLS